MQQLPVSRIVSKRFANAAIKSKIAAFVSATSSAAIAFSNVFMVAIAIAFALAFAFPFAYARAQKAPATNVAPKTNAQTQPADARPIVAPFDCSRPTVLPSTANLIWKATDPALKWGEWRVRVGENKIPILLIVAIAKAGQTQLTLDIARDNNELKPWSLANAPQHARFALNAGQFTDAGPWGWVMHRAREQQAPGAGSLAGALVVDTSGAWSIIDANEVPAKRSSGSILEAVQSYPTLVGAAGTTPRALCGGSSIDRTHRDARMVIATLPTGELMIVMTRFDGLGTSAERLPLGPTTPEMISIVRALGASRALMLDGGLSAQMLIRTGINATKNEWGGLRSVPLALVGLPLPLAR